MKVISYGHCTCHYEPREVAYRILGDMGLSEQDYRPVEIAFLIGKFIASLEAKRESDHN